MQVGGKNHNVDIIDPADSDHKFCWERGSYREGCLSVGPVTCPSIQRAFDQKPRPDEAVLLRERQERYWVLKETSGKRCR